MMEPSLIQIVEKSSASQFSVFKAIIMEAIVLHSYLQATLTALSKNQ